MQGALDCAGLEASDIDLVLAHGTATTHNDAMEAVAVHRVFGKDTPVAALKHLTGHTLAGAGSLQAAIAAALLTGNPRGHLPRQFPKGAPDGTLPPVRILREGVTLGRPLRAVLANAFAFGGSNASIILERETCHD
jgi:3-oxoacyl-[acyl-carrier-protein] synthase-1